MRIIFLSLLGLIIFYIFILFLKNWGFGFSYQESTSMTPGWYVTYPIFLKNNISRNNIILFKPDKNTENYMLSRSWILPGSPMMKYLKGLPGDFVCIRNTEIFINHKKIGDIQKLDSQNRPLPRLTFCQTLVHNQFFMMSTRVPNSFDSRYFGPIMREQMISKAIKL